MLEALGKTETSKIFIFLIDARFFGKSKNGFGAMPGRHIKRMIVRSLHGTRTNVSELSFSAYKAEKTCEIYTFNPEIITIMHLSHTEGSLIWKQ